MLKKLLILAPLVFLAACSHDEEERTNQVIQDIPAVIEDVEELETEILSPPPPPPGGAPLTCEGTTQKVPPLSKRQRKAAKKKAKQNLPTYEELTVNKRIA